MFKTWGTSKTTLPADNLGPGKLKEEKGAQAAACLLNVTLCIRIKRSSAPKPQLHLTYSAR